MDKNQLKMFGIGCLVACAICVFFGIERYNANAGNVEAMNSLQRSSPFAGMLGTGEMKAGTPAATKYALFFAVLLGAGGAILLAKSGGLEKVSHSEDSEGSS